MKNRAAQRVEDCVPAAEMENGARPPSQVTSNCTEQRQICKNVVNKFLPNQSLPSYAAVWSLLMKARTSWLVLEPSSRTPLCFGSKSCRPLLELGPGYLVHLEVPVFLTRSA